MTKSIEKQNAHFDECIKKVEAHLNAERANTKTFQEKYSDECARHSNTIKFKINIENERIKLDLKLTDLTLEHNLL